MKIIGVFISTFGLKILKHRQFDSNPTSSYAKQRIEATLILHLRFLSCRLRLGDKAPM